MVWLNKLGQHENVNFQCLRRAVSSYQHSRIRLLRHAGLTLLVIAFLVGLFSVGELIFTAFLRKYGGLGHVAATDIHIFIYRKRKQIKCIIPNLFIKIKKAQMA